MGWPAVEARLWVARAPLAAIIEERMRRFGWVPQDVAIRCGVDRKTVRNVLGDQRDWIQVDTAEALLRGIGALDEMQEMDVFKDISDES